MITLPAHFPIKLGTRPTMAASGGQARKKRGHSVQTALTLMAQMPLGGGNVGQAVQKVGSKMNATVFFIMKYFHQSATISCNFRMCWL